jgi:hypothetical protein
MNTTNKVLIGGGIAALLGGLFYWKVYAPVHYVSISFIDKTIIKGSVNGKAFELNYNNGLAAMTENLNIFGEQIQIKVNKANVSAGVPNDELRIDLINRHNGTMEIVIGNDNKGSQYLGFGQQINVAKVEPIQYATKTIPEDYKKELLKP